jgi:hypothetical protein
MGRSHNIILPNGQQIRRAINEQNGISFIKYKHELYAVELAYKEPWMKGSSIMIEIYKLKDKLKIGA